MASDLPPIDPQDPKTPAPKSVAGPRSPAWMRALLVVSLALNLAVAGVVAGAVLSGGPYQGRPNPEGLVSDLGLGPLGRALSEQDRRVLRRAAIKQRREFREVRRALRDSFGELAPLLRSDTLDVGAVTSLFDGQRATAGQRHEIAHRLLISRFEEMTVAERRALADRLEEGLKRGPKRRDKPRKERD